MSLWFPTINARTKATTKASAPRHPGHRLRKFIVALIVITEILTFCYAGISVFVAMRVEYMPPLPITNTPAAYGLAYRDVTFYSRVDHLRLTRLVHPRRSS